MIKNMIIQIDINKDGSITLEEWTNYILETRAKTKQTKNNNDKIEKTESNVLLNV
jgi:hypothetical protein